MTLHRFVGCNLWCFIFNVLVHITNIFYLGRYRLNSHTAYLIQLHGNFCCRHCNFVTYLDESREIPLLGLPNSIIEEPTDDLTKKFKDFSKSHADQPNVVIVHQGGMIPYPVSMFHIIMHLCSAFSDIYGFFLQFHGFTLVKRAPSHFS